ncbi:MAG: type I restriction-modification system subunit M [Succiniclasticum sp.]|uniref:type I restriction-modification system subunit M n=1 Tax=Succiniclasticum sp. TaxID=2775030 RepID=UPI002A91E093|nr:type I restriction-modification system subunit M [Succiniclasticum sp.]MDY6289976.1 type I restriction-modification system subunit M [Succiniclasticum sp.]
MAVDNKKEQERDELHRAIWAIADELRGAVDGWDFKNYVLGTMFYRYISENLTAYINEGEEDAGNKGFDYANLSDAEAEEAREGLVEEKGFFILPSELFCNVRAKADRGEVWKYPNGQDMLLNEKLEAVFQHIEESAKGSESEADFAGLFDDFDVNSNKLGSTVAKRNERLVKLLNGIADMKLGSVKDHEIDAFGDAYEYLMGMYASNAGKSGGEFFTPADVSVLLTRLGTVGKKTINKVYDPACGSGSLLLKVEKILGKDAVQIGFFGQEINITTYNLCRINMFLHDIGFNKFDIACEDTLINPQHWDDEPFELIVSNPPYSIKWEGDDNPLLINDPRYSPASVLAPKSKADLAFIMHSLAWLAPNGTAAIVCFPGVMYRGGKEQKIRKYLVDNNFVDCVIQLPDNLFFGTSIATCIMVMKRGKQDNKILFIDASKQFVKVTNNNKLLPEHIDTIVDAFTKREYIQYFCRLVDYNEVKEQNYNLSVSTYVEQEDNREKVDIKKLNAEIKEIVAREQVLRDEIDKIIAEIEGGQDA